VLKRIKGSQSITGYLLPFHFTNSFIAYDPKNYLLGRLQHRRSKLIQDQPVLDQANYKLIQNK